MVPLETFPNLNDSNVLAPAGGIGLIIWFLYQAAKHYKEGRRIDVAAAEAREKEAERRADELETDTRREIESLKRQMQEEKRERNQNELMQEGEIRRLRKKVNALSRLNYELRQVVITNGLGEVLKNIEVDPEEETT